MGWGEGKEGLEGEDFPGNFGKPPDRQIRQGPPSQKFPFWRDSTPPPNLAYAHMRGVVIFIYIKLY